MRNFKIFTTAALFVAAVLTMTGCNSSSEPDFGLYSFKSFAIQDVAEMEGYPTSQYHSYLPFAAFNVAYGNLTKGSFSKSGSYDSYYGKMYGNYYETSLSYNNPIYSAEDVNGNYTISAVSEDGQSDAFTFTIKVNDEKQLGSLSDKIVEFEYANSGHITAKIERVENAKQYAFYIVYEYPELDEYNPFIFGTGTMTNPVNANADIQSLNQQFDSYSQVITKARIYPVVIYYEEGYSTVVKFGKYKTLKHGASSFEEDL